MTPFRIVERFVRGKAGDGRLCEDMLVATETHAAVIDGASDPTGTPVGGTAPGRFAAEAVAGALAALPAEADLDEACRHARAALDRALAEARAPADAFPFCVFVAYSAARREIWCVGDGQWAIDGRPDAGVLGPVDALVTLRGVMAAGELARGRSIDELLRDDPLHRLSALVQEASRALVNRDDLADGWPAICPGRDVPLRMQRAIPVPPNARDIVLASDGYPILLRTLAETEAHLAARLARDPLLLEEPRQPRGVRPGWRSYDDRAWLRLAV